MSRCSANVLLLGLAALGSLPLTACSNTADDATSNQSAVSEGDGTSNAPACSLTYWNWVLHELQPRMDRPIGEVSEERLMEMVASHPAAQYTANGYGTCWAPIFDKYFFASAATRLHDARVSFLDANSASYRSRDLYVTNATMTPEIRRNAKALLALLPSTMRPTDVDSRLVAYDTLLAEAIEPLGIPSLHAYENVVEDEWVIDDAEAEYLAVVEKSLPAPSEDGVYGEWIRDYGKWLFGPPPAMTRSFVFNLAWEPGASSDDYGLGGIAMQGATPSVPGVVTSFLGHLKSTTPEALGNRDSAAWMSLYNARALRALGDLSQQQPMLTNTDTLALDMFEDVRPSTLRGLDTYRIWIGLEAIAAGQADSSWSERFAALEPCVDSADLEAANQARSDDAGRASVGVPRACVVDDVSGAKH